MWCVFGCGGDRDASKRPLMGAIASQKADQVVVTSDNPRSEKPEAIVAQILLGVAHSNAVDVQKDRALAIADAIARADANDVVLLAGKGHEDTQEIAGVKNLFSDRDHAAAGLAQSPTPHGGTRMNSMMTVAQAVQWLPGSRMHGDGATVVQRVHTDTRTIEPGDLFVALKGERYDANAFLLEAQQRGAVAAVCHPGADRSGVTAMACIEVPDTRLALGELGPCLAHAVHVAGDRGRPAATARPRSPRCWPPFWPLSGPDGGSLATRGNFNNDIGVPLTLLRLRQQHRIAVVELGMNHPGEIAVLAAMVQPTVALVNNAQREHLEFMHTVRAVALENGSVITPVGPQGRGRISP